MKSFEELKIHKSQLKALRAMEIESPTPIQEKAIPAVLSGRDVVGLAQTGTGKTLAYLLPLLKLLPYAEQTHPRVLILVPTRELVMQVKEILDTLCSFQNTRISGIYGGTNINKQKEEVLAGTDIIVATPGRLFDLAVSGVLRLSAIQKLVIDEVDEMFFIGFRPQLMNILDILPKKRQNIMFSATLPEEVEELITDHFVHPKKIEIVPVGTPIDKISQLAIPVPNYKTKVNLLKHLLGDEQLKKVLIFTRSKKIADRLLQDLADDQEEKQEESLEAIHSNKSQNFRFQAIDDFEKGVKRGLIATDIVSRGMDLTAVSHVINFDMPKHPEQYIHRIGRTGRASESGKAILLFTPDEEEALLDLEIMMMKELPIGKLPEGVEVSKELMPEEIDRSDQKEVRGKNGPLYSPGPAFHEKLEKNKKTNLGGAYKRELKKKYKKPKKRPPKNPKRGR